MYTFYSSELIVAVVVTMAFTVKSFDPLYTAVPLPVPLLGVNVPELPALTAKVPEIVGAVLIVTGKDNLDVATNPLTASPKGSAVAFQKYL